MLKNLRGNHRNERDFRLPRGFKDVRKHVGERRARNIVRGCGKARQRLGNALCPRWGKISAKDVPNGRKQQMRKKTILTRERLDHVLKGNGAKAERKMRFLERRSWVMKKVRPNKDAYGRIRRTANHQLLAWTQPWQLFLMAKGNSKRES